MGLELIDPEKLASEPSMLAVEKQREQQQHLQQPRHATAVVGACAGSGDGGGEPFTFVIGSPVENPRVVPTAAAKLL